MESNRCIYEDDLHKGQGLEPENIARSQSPVNLDQGIDGNGLSEGDPSQPNATSNVSSRSQKSIMIDFRGGKSVSRQGSIEVHYATPSRAAHAGTSRSADSSSSSHSLDDCVSSQSPATRYTPEELKACQSALQEELDSLSCIYDPSSLTIIYPSSLRFVSNPVILSVVCPPNYPSLPGPPPRISVRGEGGFMLSKLKAFEVEMRLNDIIEERRGAGGGLDGEVLLFDVLEEVRDICRSLKGADFNESIYDEVEDWERDVSEADAGLRINDAFTIQNLMGKTTIDSIMAELGSSINLLHAEIVLRKDLLHRFHSKQERFRRLADPIKDRRSRDAKADELSRLEIVFHGTPRRNVGSIVRSGFVVPGATTKDGETVGVRCGSTWGVGTYTSPDPSFSLSYTDFTHPDITYEMLSPEEKRNLGPPSKRKLLPGQKLLVCAALMGRRYHLKNGEYRRQTGGAVCASYDSHISPSRKEYIIFDSAQLLPIYVLHIEEAMRDYSWRSPPGPSAVPQKSKAGTGNGSLVVLKSMMGKGENVEELTEEKRKKLLTDHARKYFPFGFGRARGGNFVVEEVGEIDDDEEVWGEFQDNPATDEFQACRHDSLWS